MVELGENQQSLDLELVLADHSKFPHAGKLDAIEAEFNTKTQDIAFRADFPNPNGLLRHGQTGTLLINRVLKDAILIPQRATFEDHAKRYVYVVDKDHVAHQREIVIQNETEDLFVVKKGVGVGDRIVLEGVRLVRDGDKVE
jgi:membrane fusion protein (multidrug efflux system)